MAGEDALKRTIEFDFDVGEKVRLTLMDSVVGTVISLWCSDRGPKYEVAYYVESERKIDYFYVWELLQAPEKLTVGFGREKK